MGMADADTNPLGRVIQFGPAVFSSPQTIVLNSALPDLSNPTGLTEIEGTGPASLTVARNSATGILAFSIFSVDAHARVNLGGLTIAGGLAAARSPQDGATDGGGIYNTAR